MTINIIAFGQEWSFTIKEKKVEVEKKNEKNRMMY